MKYTHFGEQILRNMSKIIKNDHTPYSTLHTVHNVLLSQEVKNCESKPCGRCIE